MSSLFKTSLVEDERNIVGVIFLSDTKADCSYGLFRWNACRPVITDMSMKRELTGDNAVFI